MNIFPLRVFSSISWLNNKKYSRFDEGYLNRNNLKIIKIRINIYTIKIIADAKSHGF